MTEGGFKDLEMKDLSREYTEYDDMTREELNYKYDSLKQDRLNLLRDDTGNKDEMDSVKERLDYIIHLQENKFVSRAGETTFTISNNEIEYNLLNDPENEKNIWCSRTYKKKYIKMKIIFLIQYTIKKHLN